MIYERARQDHLNEIVYELFRPTTHSSMQQLVSIDLVAKPITQSTTERTRKNKRERERERDKISREIYRERKGQETERDTLLTLSIGLLLVD